MTESDFQTLMLYLNMAYYGAITGIIYLMLFRLFNFKGTK